MCQSTDQNFEENTIKFGKSEKLKLKYRVENDSENLGVGVNSHFRGIRMKRLSDRSSLICDQVVKHQRTIFCFLILIALMPPKPFLPAAISDLACKTTLLLSGTQFGAMLDMLTDRCATMCLLVNLSLLYPSYTFLFQLSMTLDVASHWLHLHRCRRRSRSPKLRDAGR